MAAGTNGNGEYVRFPGANLAQRLTPGLRLFVAAAVAFQMAGVPLSAYASSSDGNASEETATQQLENAARKAVPQGEAADISAAWESGEASIQEAGTYKLSEDVSANSPLKISLEDGEVALLDMSGHSAKVRNQPLCVDATGSRGTVFITDSSSKDSAPGNRAQLVLETTNPKKDAAVIEAGGSQGEEGDLPAVIAKGVAFSMEVHDGNGKAASCTASAVKSSPSPAMQASSKQQTRFAFVLDSCSLGTRISGKTDAWDADSQAAGNTAKRACVVDVQGARVKLDGQTSMKLDAGGTGDTDARLPMLLSAQESAYVLGRDFALSEDTAAKEAESAQQVILGFPSSQRAAQAGRATVAVTESGSKLAKQTIGRLKAESGYTVAQESARDGSGAATESIVLVKDSSANPTDTEGSTSSAQAASTSDGAQAQEGGSSENAAASPSAKSPRLASPALRNPSPTVQSEGTNLREAWGKQQNGFKATYTIAAGGTYYLDDDLVAEANLVVNAPGADVTLRFSGHSMTLDGGGLASLKTMLSIAAAKSVTLDGSAAEGVSCLASAGESDVIGIGLSAADCALHVNDLNVKLHSKTNTQRNLFTHALRATGGDVDLKRCEIEMDMGNQALRNMDLVNGKDAPEPPSAVYATEEVFTVNVEDCKVVSQGPCGFSLDTLTDLEGLGNTYALYSLSQETLVKGGSFKAVSARGNATCLYAKNLELQPDAEIALEADAGQLATGVLSSERRGALLDAPLAFGVGALYEGTALVEAALRSSVEDGFVFGSCAPAQASTRYPVLVLEQGETIQSANADGTIVGTFGSSADSGTRAATAAALDNACGPSGAVPGMSGGRIVFQRDDARAVACINFAEYYSTLGAALAVLEDGDVLTLLADVPSVAIGDVSSATLDLNGHVIGSLEYSATSDGAGLVVKSGKVNATTPVSAAKAAVYHRAKAPLTLEGVDIDISVSNARTYGLYATAASGDLRLRNCTVSVLATQTSSSNGAAAYGINMASNGPKLTLDSSTVCARSSSAGVAAYGVYSSKEARIEDSSVSAASSTGLCSAFYVAGNASARNSTFDACTTGVASAAYGVWANASTPKAENISVDSCKVSVRSMQQDVSAGNYICLAGSSSETGTVAPAGAWTLSGHNALKSAGGVHIGLSAGSIVLGSGFDLDGSSDSPLVVSQAQCPDDAGITFASGVSKEDAERAAGLFVAKSGSWYQGSRLVAEGEGGQVQCLVWRAEQDAGDGVVQVLHDGTTANYRSFAQALENAQAGDTVSLLADICESGVFSTDLDNLAIDLGGHALTLRAGNRASASGGTGAGLAYRGSGTLRLANGTLAIEAGQATESVLGAAYQGLLVAGGGTLEIGADAVVAVTYAGSTSASASQRAVTLRGIAVQHGTLEHKGELRVAGAAKDAGLGAFNTFGIYVSNTADCEVRVHVASGASVHADNKTGAISTRDAYHVEESGNQAGPAGLREIVPDKDADPAFYQAILDQFRLSALFDDPNDTTARGTFSCSVYYALGMVLDAQDEDAWYKGLRVWAFSDEVAPQNVGKKEYIVPAHVFISSAYDAQPQSCGVAGSAASTGKTLVDVEGKVEASCPHGTARSLDAQCAEGAQSIWRCVGAQISAQGDELVHAKAQRAMDLRDYIKFTSSQEKRVAYSGIANAQVVEFEATPSRNIYADGNVQLHLDGAMRFTAEGAQAANIESATPFTVGSAFDVAAGACSLAHPEGANEPGTAFAKPEQGAVNADLFEDAYRQLEAAVSGDGGGVWKAGTEFVTLFNVGGATIARYSGAASIDLSPVSVQAQDMRPADVRQAYAIVGWSKSPDENATGGYVAPDGQLQPESSATYYAVFSTGLARVGVSFTNIFDSAGTAREPLTLQTRYGQTVEEALDAAGVSAPSPEDYEDARAGVTYRFAGWHVQSSSAAVSPRIYSTEQAKELEVMLALNGVATGALELRAVYIATRSDEHLVSFVVDGATSTCVVKDGEHPDYTAANDANSNYTDPAKTDTQTGKTFIFEGWFEDSDSDGKPSDGEDVYAGALPGAHGDATYAAQWSSKWSDVTYTFYVKYVDSSTDELVSNGVRTIETTYGTSAQKAADDIAEVGSSFGYGGKVYTLDGWTTRKTDVEPMYDAQRKIPAVAGTESTMTSSYPRTFYGVYTIVDHKLDVTFIDGSMQVGTARNVLASSTVNTAFAASGAAVPQDKSATSVFLGWAASPGASAAVGGTATRLDMLVGATDKALSLYAVYGPVPSYSVRLRSADGNQTLYQVTLKRGTSVKDALAQAGIAVSVPAQSGKCFSGFVTASGVLFSLDQTVDGSMDLYAAYADVSVQTPDAKDASGTATVSHPTALAKAFSPGIASAELTLTRRTSADSPIRTTAAKNGYTVLKCYDLRLSVKDVRGEAYPLTGNIGSADVRIYVGAKYRNAKVRVFWLGEKENRETVMNSAEKKPDANGYITVSIGNFVVGDADEGGNIAVAYVEGGKSGKTLGAASLSGGTGSKTVALGGSSKRTATLGAAPSGSGGLGGGPSGASDGLAPSKALASQNAPGHSGEDQLSSNPGASDEAQAGDQQADASGVSGEGQDGEGQQQGLDSDGVALVLLAAAMLGAVLHRLWLLLGAKRRKDDDDEELPDLQMQYSKGIRF